MPEGLSVQTLETLVESFWRWIAGTLLVADTVVQFGALAVIFLLALPTYRPLRNWLTHLSERLAAPAIRHFAEVVVGLTYWLVALILLWLAAAIFRDAGARTDILRIATSLLAAWVVIRLTASLVRDHSLARTISILAWSLAALNILNLLDPFLGVLDSLALTIGEARISVLAVAKAVLALTLLLWLASALARLTEQRLKAMPNLTPSVQVLAAKLVKITLITIAILAAISAVGLDLTVFAVFSGAVGVGLGFGLQKVVSNLFSGVILLADRSIKPGDVIEIEGTYGWITRLNARYVSVVTRDNTEFLIPNEDLITHRVINWSYTNNLVRLRVPIGVSYDSDIRKAMQLCIDAVHDAPRAMEQPKPRCLLMGFGDSSVDLELRFWIADPQNGTANVRSEILLGIWDRFKSNGITIPFPQRDVHIRDWPGKLPSEEEG